eukprot:743256-Pyramimonas_sp.AAC.1
MEVTNSAASRHLVVVVAPAAQAGVGPPRQRDGVARGRGEQYLPGDGPGGGGAGSGGQSEALLSAGGPSQAPPSHRPAEPIPGLHQARPVSRNAKPNALEEMFPLPVS